MFSLGRLLLRQQRELDALRREVAALRAQNESMRQGMRRCVTCDYRIDYKRRQDEALDREHPTAARESAGDTSPPASTT